MPVFEGSGQLYAILEDLFDRIRGSGADAIQSVASSRLVIRIHCSQPEAEVTINGRREPVQIQYGETRLRPDLDVSLSAEALHDILLGELRLRRAITEGHMKVRGPLLKTYVLEDVLHRGQALYPQVLHSHGMDGYRGANS